MRAMGGLQHMHAAAVAATRSMPLPSRGARPARPGQLHTSRPMDRGRIAQLHATEGGATPLPLPWQVAADDGMSTAEVGWERDRSGHARQPSGRRLHLLAAPCTPLTSLHQGAGG